MDDSLDHCHLRIDDAAHCSTDGDIIGEHNKFDVQYGTLAYSSNRDSSTVLVISIQAGLRAVRLLMHEYSMSGSRGTTQSRRIGDVHHQGLTHLLWTRRWPPRKPHRHRHRVPVDNRHPSARRTHAERLARAHIKRLDSIVPVDEAPEDLEGFPLHLLSFTVDEGNDVVKDVEAGYPGVSRARDDLHGGDDAQFDRTKGLFERAEGYDEARGGAVCVGEDEALLERRVMEGLLLCDHGEVEVLTRGTTRGTWGSRR